MPWHKPRVREADADAVILLHGLWRSLWAMEPMAKYLNDHGYHTINVPYPSFRKPMEELTGIIHDAMTLHGGDRRIHFVTHSLGGVLARRLLRLLPPGQAGRVVMLAPPHQGSEIIDWVAQFKPLAMSLGPAGMQLGSGKIDAPALPEAVDSAVIMGTQSAIPFFRKLLDQENDGIVSVERGKIDGMKEFQVLDADHTFIASDPRVMEMTLKFLRDGKTV
ncbi:MAG: alpha/beta hydrolase [Akkermansiaceae bacterium]|nr:alpha/beta hydrolase [Akkermansiaceae bacterium]